MNAVKQSIWMFITLLCLACSGWYFASNETLLQLDDKTLDNTVDVIIHHLIVNQYDEEGRLTHYLKTPLMEHTPLNNTHHLKQPHIIVSPPNKQAWDIKAMRATALYNGKQITFNEQVIIHQDASEHTHASHLKTEEITYFPESKFATTLKQIEFTQQGSIVTAIGMNAFLDENRVQLLNHAQGIYVPTHG